MALDRVKSFKYALGSEGVKGNFVNGRNTSKYSHMAPLRIQIKRLIV